jgi:hypothetical protein
MRDYNFLKNMFLEKNKIDNIEYLEKYIKLMIEYKLLESEDYTEKHHILPRSVFPEFENEDWNIIELKYEDHVNAHLYLFKSINIRQYQRPLNWMLNQYKNREEISNSAKIGWINLKNDKDKYEKWRNNRSNHMKSLSSEEQKRRAKLFWDNITEEQYDMFSNKMKQYWTDEKRNEKSKQMNEHYSDPKNIIKKSIESQKRWDSMCDDERERFNLKMNIVNKDEEKRRVAGEKIKNLWKSDEYLEKMKNRPHRKGTSILIIRPEGDEIIINTMREMEKIYQFNSNKIRKYRDTDLCIKEEDLKDNKFLLNCKIKTIKNG